MPPLVFQVIPLRRLPPKFELLDYDFSASAPPPEHGEIVRIPFGTQTIEGVLWAQGVSVSGQGAKRKTLERQEKLTYLTPQQLGLVHWLAQETLAALPVVALSMLPGSVPSTAAKLKENTSNGIIAAHLDERQKIIQQFAKQAAGKGKTLVLVPALAYSHTWQKAFGERCIVIHGKLTSRQKAKLLATDAQVIVTTAVGLYLPHRQLRHLILDQADDDGYFAFDQAPRVDTRRVAYELSRLHGAAFTLLARWQSPTLRGLFPNATWRGMQPPPFTFIDRNGEAGAERRKPIAAGLLERVHSGRTLWLVHRRNEAGQLRCQDCGVAMQCPTCSRPLQVVRVGGRQMLFCRHDKLHSLVPDTCPRCKSAQLSTQGKGVEVIADEIQAQLGQTVTILDAGKTLTGTVSNNVVATTAIANYPEYIFDRVVIVRTESFLAPGHYRSSEELHGVLALARQQVRPGGELYCQTFQPDNAEFVAGEELCKREQTTRGAMHFPPFGTLVILQPRARALRPADQPFSSPVAEELRAIAQAPNRWLIRCAQADRRKTLQRIHETLDASWEAIVDPPRIPAD